jgi:hypothetical protein
MLEVGESTKAFLDPDVGLEFGGEIRQKYSSKYPRGKNMTPMPTDPALLSYFQDIVGQMQSAPPKRAHDSTTLAIQGDSDLF